MIEILSFLSRINFSLYTWSLNVCVFFSLSLQFFALMLLVFGLEVAGTVLGYVYRDQVRKKSCPNLFCMCPKKLKCCAAFEKLEPGE